MSGFRPRKTVADAIDEVIAALESGDVVDRDEWYTVRWMAQSVVQPDGV